MRGVSCGRFARDLQIIVTIVIYEVDGFRVPRPGVDCVGASEGGAEVVGDSRVSD